MTNQECRLTVILICPNCKGNLIQTNDKFVCLQCDKEFSKNQYGFFDFVLDPKQYEISSTTDVYARTQETTAIRVYKEYLHPILEKEPYKQILNVGCGMGNDISLMISEGYDAYGIDLPNLSKYWNYANHNSEHFFSSDAVSLPFKDNYFDVVYSFGVIEHIGTITGNATLYDNYWEYRKKYANEILRVTKPNGRIIIACPNKSHPFDLLHGPGGQTGLIYKIRKYIYDATKINIHPIFGNYHLLSYAETKNLFCSNDRDRRNSFNSLPMNNYFNFKKDEKLNINKFFYKFMEIYLNYLPNFLRTSGFNPYVMVQIRK